MARIFTEGFEMGDLLGLSSINGGAIIKTSSPAPRSGVYCLYCSDITANVTIDIDDKTELYFRAGVRCVSVDTGSTTILFGAYNSTTPLIRINMTTLSLSLQVGTATTGTAFYTINQSVWYLLEVYVKIHDTEGVVTVKLDGIEVYSFSGDTKPGADTTINNIVLGQKTSAVNYPAFDDIAINDTTGSVDNSWCGDGRIIALKTNASGDITNLTNSAGTQVNNYTYVDDIPADGDTTFVYGDSENEYDLYGFENPSIPVNNIPKMVWVEGRAKTTGSGTGRMVIKSSGSEITSGSMALGYEYGVLLSEYYSIDPITSGSWSQETLDAIQAGMKIGGI